MGLFCRRVDLGETGSTASSCRFVAVGFIAFLWCDQDGWAHLLHGGFFEIWESPRRTGWQIFCPPKRYYRLFGNSCISGDSRLISCNNNYRYFAALLFVKKSFDTIEVSEFLRRPLFQSRIPTSFFFRVDPQQPSPRRFPWKIRYWTALRVQFCRELGWFASTKNIYHTQNLRLDFCWFHFFDLVIDPNKSTKSNQQNQRFNFLLGK